MVLSHSTRLPFEPLRRLLTDGSSTKSHISAIITRVLENTNTQIHKYKYTNTNPQIQIHKYKYTNTNTQKQIHKYKYTNANTQMQIHKHKYTNRDTQI